MQDIGHKVRQQLRRRRQLLIPQACSRKAFLQHLCAAKTKDRSVEGWPVGAGAGNLCRVQDQVQDQDEVR